MATKQGYLKEKGSQDKLAPKTLDSLVKDSARNRALSASLQELAERQCLGYPPFATTQNYTVGDKVFYDRKLWKFTSSHTAGAWNASHVTAWSVDDEVSELKLAVTALDERKANIDGFYEGMGVGVAKAIAGNQRLDEVFTSMVVDGADGVAKINEVRGKSLVWNQLVQNPSFEEGEQSPTYYNLTGCTATRIGKMLELHPQEGSTDIRVVSNASTKRDHKYYFSVYSSYNGSGIGLIAVTSYNNSTYTKCWGSDINSTLNKYSAIVTNTADGLGFILDLGRVKSGVSSTDVVQVMYPILVDLTQMFGAGNEPATVEEFESMFPNDYYEYNDGEIINNATEKLDVTGFNQWDEEWGKGNISQQDGETVDTGLTTNLYSINKIKVFPNTAYYIKKEQGHQAVRVFLYDVNGNYMTSVTNPTGATYTVPSGVYYIRFQGAYEGNYKHDTCINLSDPSRNGTYEPYKHGVVSLNLSTITGKQVGVEDAESVVIFPDGMRQAGNVADTLLVDDDGYARRAMVKVGRIDIGQHGILDSQTDGGSSGDLKYFRIKNINDAKVGVFNVVVEKYGTSHGTSRFNMSDKSVSPYNAAEKKVCICDSAYNGSTAAQFESAMVGVTLYYELETPIEYILDEPILMTFKAYHGGTIVQSPQAPDSAPMSMNVTFALDAVGTLNNLPKNYISADSMDAFLAQLGTAMNGTWTKSWDAANSKYTFSFQSSQTE